MRPPGDSAQLAVRTAVLTLGTGAVDVAAFTRLGGAFASVMTGNLVLLGMSATQASSDLAVHTGVAVAGYITGAAAGARVAGRAAAEEPAWPSSVTVVLLLELVVLAGFTVGWELAGGRPEDAAQLALLGVAALAMGLQSSAMRRLPTGVSTTYLTGTLTGVVGALARREGLSAADRRSVAILACLAGGACVGGALVLFAPWALPVVPLTTLTFVIGWARYRSRQVSD
ncbi:MAG TPA: DUF1275 family protein [Segeticoccus sp.]|uniref:DUF1275 family protein n=1 Tax=Segeticoccus sp. TaxID=2706531 RepID=UPI002D7E72A5|nr:DUF1275 family protein [Segeticoccus sp.]HET8600458.1 DUF1275 family protein [Segeticoccus sp.]